MSTTEHYFHINQYWSMQSNIARNEQWYQARLELAETPEAKDELHKEYQKKKRKILHDAHRNDDLNALSERLILSMGFTNPTRTLLEIQVDVAKENLKDYATAESDCN
jgi:hypothetical protein